jgi:uncharacterized protein YggU (UPF0235/DUF167 family)
MPVNSSVRTLRVRVTPRSSINAIIKWEDDTLFVRLTAPPVDSAANEALREFIADRLNIARSRVQLNSGERSRVKTLAVEGYSLDWPWLDSLKP